MSIGDQERAGARKLHLLGIVSGRQVHASTPHERNTLSALANRNESVALIRTSKVMNNSFECRAGSEHPQGKRLDFRPFTNEEI
jgi:hypothetical protein